MLSINLYWADSMLFFGFLGKNNNLSKKKNKFPLMAFSISQVYMHGTWLTQNSQVQNKEGFKIMKNVKIDFYSKACKCMILPRSLM